MYLSFGPAMFMSIVFLAIAMLGLYNLKWKFKADIRNLHSMVYLEKRSQKGYYTIMAWMMFR